MADFRIMTSPDQAAGGGMDQITVVRIDDTHIQEEQSHVGGKVKDGAECYEVEYLMPADDEVVGEDEDDGVYVIEYSNPEEEGESYQFTMSVDRSLPAKRPRIKHPFARESGRAPLPVMSKPPGPQRPRHEVSKPPGPPRPRHEVSKPPGPQRPRHEAKQKKMLAKEAVAKKKKKEEEEEEVVSNKRVLELGEDYSDVIGTNSGKEQLVCTLCPVPRVFKRGAGLAVHLKHVHRLQQAKKTFFCTTCQQSVPSQIKLDLHTKRHANQEAVFTCVLCPENTTESPGFRGSRWGLKKHLETQHPGVIPRCHFCNKNFRTVVSYLSDQFRHVGVSPHFCAKCHIYEMTERGLSIHIKNHDKKNKMQLQLQEQPPPADRLPPPLGAAAAAADNSATDDSDF